MNRFVQSFSLMLTLSLPLVACSNTLRNESNWDAPAAPQTSAVHQTAQMALLLPMSGSQKDFGEDIRDGFINAQLSQSNGSRAEIKVYDTETAPVDQLYQQAVAEGAQLVVGPLSKNQVAALAQRSPLAVPTLALNYLPPNQSSPGGFYQFGLSAKDEALSAAEQGIRSGYTRVLILYPNNNPKAQEVAETFAQRWRTLGGTIQDRMGYTLGPSLNSKLQDVLHVDEQVGRSSLIKRQDREGQSLQSFRREDIDLIFLSGTHAAARQIMPLLKYNFAGDIPVYATSSVYKINSNITNRDLEGLFFTQIPWTLRRLTENDARNHSSLLYAFGMDAYTLASELLDQRLGQRDIAGQTGTLRLDHQQIHRSFALARVRQGAPQPIG